MKTTFDALMAIGGPVIADGGMGTMLLAMGLARGDTPERWNIIKPEKIREVHRGYIKAGAQIILTNSFGGNRLRLGAHGLADRPHELNRAAAKLARAEANAADQPVLVAGAMGPTGRMLEPQGDLSYEDAVAAFAEQAAALEDGGVDVFWIETMSDLEEVRAAIEGCQQAAPDLPRIATMTFEARGYTKRGIKPEQAAAAISEMGVVALGANCGNGPDEIEAVIEKMAVTGLNVPLVAKANAGMPLMQDGEAIYDITPEGMAEYGRRVCALGATIVGACCGSKPIHIQAIAEALQLD